MAQSTSLPSVGLSNNGQFNRSDKTNRATKMMYSLQTSSAGMRSFTGLRGANALDMMAGRTLQSKVAASPVFKSPTRLAVQASSTSVNLQNKVELLLDSIKWDDKGLAVAIAQNVDTGAILMQGFVNREALSKTISSKKATFYSRSRKSLWTKGETSMNFINVCDVFIDCDRDSILYLGKPDGPTCHTGSETCYYTSVNQVLQNPDGGANELALTTLYSLEATINKRKDELSVNSDGKLSWTKRLLLDPKLLCSKIREEADELCRTLEENEDKSRTISEMADLLYHAIVFLILRVVKMEDVLQVLRQRFARSGIEEKGSRKS